jgi:hypothetical protein
MYPVTEDTNIGLELKKWLRVGHAIKLQNKVAALL